MNELSPRTVNFTQPQISYLREESDRLGITVSDLIRRIIDQFRGQKNARRDRDEAAN